jgi:hypothetical protein
VSSGLASADDANQIIVDLRIDDEEEALLPRSTNQHQTLPVNQILNGDGVSECRDSFRELDTVLRRVARSFCLDSK